MSRVVHHLLRCPDNGGDWVPDESRYFCKLCGAKSSRVVKNPDFYLKKKNYDISITYDGFYIASEKFVSTVRKIPRCDFSVDRIISDKRYSTEYYLLEFNGVVKIDIGRAEPDFGPVCDGCGRHTYLVGAYQYFIEGGAELKQGIFRTDLEFGSDRGMGPVIVVGTESAEILRAQKFKGLHLEAVRDGP